jgi:arsenite/tail-anchored protein-transporting ATPase
VPGLLERLGRPTTFVVGKGGVGKTTTAGALALALADSGLDTHLLSTDPAHSLGDLFQQPLGRDPAPSHCTGRLVLEELDAEGLAGARLESLRPALLEVIDGGTYLDVEDAESLLGASLPGLDEIGAALRVVTLGAEGARLVVDTAPTGHTLRMLDSESTVDGWLHVFRAMADKADTVASALVGRPVRLRAETELQRLAEDMAAFSHALEEADFLVVTAPGVVVRAETERLVRELQGRGLRVAGTVAMARPGADADVLLPLRSGLQGCEALREWWLAADSGRGGGRGLRPTAAPAAGARSRPVRLDPALDRGLVVFAGKGGVGKTTCASALAVRFAEEGPVVLMGADPAGSLADVVAGTVPDLAVWEADAEAALARLEDRYRDEVEEVFAAAGLDRAAAMDRAIIESLWNAAPPGIDEVMAIVRLAEDVPEGSRIVLDTAPTGHFLRLVAMPDVALDWTHKVMRILLKYRAVGGLDAPAGPLIRLAKRFRALRERLADPSRTAIIVVTLEEPLVQAETGRLIETLRHQGLPLAAVVVNHAGDHPIPRSGDGSGPAHGVPTFRAPTVPEPTGPDALRAFARAWERVA